MVVLGPVVYDVCGRGIKVRLCLRSSCHQPLALVAVYSQAVQ